MTDEVGVQFDEVQLVSGLQELEDLMGDGSCSGADFKDPHWVLRGACSEEASHGSSEEAAAGSDGARCFESFSELGEERQVISQCAGHVMFHEAAERSLRSSSSRRSVRERQERATGSPTGAPAASCPATRFSAATTVE